MREVGDQISPQHSMHEKSFVRMYANDRTVWSSLQAVFLQQVHALVHNTWVKATMNYLENKLTPKSVC